MMDLRVFKGAAGEREIDWIADLYGPVDPKYADVRFVRHQFTENPVGWSLHVFALADGCAVGHCALLPMPARIGDERIVSGKFEAFAVDPMYQSAELADGRLVGLALIAELYAHAPAVGFDVVHDLVQPDIGLMHRLHGAQRIAIPWQTLVGVGDPRALAALGRKRAIAGRGVAWWQKSLRLVSGAAIGRALVREVGVDDEPPRSRDILFPGSWTIAAADMWEWLVGTELLAWVEDLGGGRALVRVPGPGRQAAELIDWHPGRRPLAGATATINAVAQLGREGRSVRIPNPRDDPDLRRAARILGLLPARDPLTLYVKGVRPGLDAANVAVNPFFFATF